MIANEEKESNGKRRFDRIGRGMRAANLRDEIEKEKLKDKSSGLLCVVLYT